MLYRMEVAVTDLAVNELYDRLTIQGEGPDAGRVCSFLRLWGCNLHCRWCDTPYTWDTKGRNGTVYPASTERHLMSVSYVWQHFHRLGAPLVVVSGGEPLLQLMAVQDLAFCLATVGIETHVESNATVKPPPPEHDQVVSRWVLSPKLASAEAGWAQRSDALEGWSEYAQSHPARVAWKVVINGMQDLSDALALFDLFHVPDVARWVMLQSDVANEATRRTERETRQVVEAAVNAGVNLSPRMHVDLWGQERGR